MAKSSSKTDNRWIIRYKSGFETPPMSFSEVHFFMTNPKVVDKVDFAYPIQQYEKLKHRHSYKETDGESKGRKDSH